MNLFAYCPIRITRKLVALGLIRPNYRPAVFIHIQKTAGTSMVHTLSRHYADSFMSHGDFLGKTHAEVNSMALVAGHFGYGYAAQYIKGRVSFTFLREPRERIVSFYNYCRLHKDESAPIYQLTQNVSLDQFLDLGHRDNLVRDYIYNHQTWQLASGWGNPSGMTLSEYNDSAMLGAALSNIRQLSLIGIVDNFYSDFRLLLKMLNLPLFGSRVWRNKSAFGSSIKSLPSGTRSRLDSLVELDDALYQKVVEWRKGSR